MMSPLPILNAHHVIRLTGFRSRTAQTSEVGVAQAWRTMWDAAPSGLRYAELCEQVPDWNRQAAAEIESPIPFDFLEYAVFEPETDFTSLPALPEMISSRHDIVQGLYTVAFRFAKDDATTSPGAVMFNLFEIDGPPGMEQGFLMNWPPRGAFKIGEDAVTSTILHQRLQAGQMIAAFNRAEVRDAAGYAEGIGRFEAAFPRAQRKGRATEPESHSGPATTPPIRSHLGLFRIAASLTGPAPASAMTMQAARVHHYGGSDALVYEDVARPHPGPGQILVEVKASAINPLDVRMRSGEVRAIYPPWFPDTLGYSIAGVVAEIGAGVTSLQVGDEVYGINNPIMRGGYAEYLVGPATFFYSKPDNADFAAAAAAPSVFATAHGALFGRADLRAGQRILIHGASGVIGSCAVQLAKHVGAVVYATASTKNLDAVRALGADVVIDYTTQRFEDIATELDMVLDTVGGETRDRSWSLLKSGGTLASLQPPDPDPDTAARFGVQAFMVHGHPNIAEIMADMTRRLERGDLNYPDIAAVFPLAEAAAAHAAFEEHPPRGRIILTP